MNLLEEPLAPPVMFDVLSAIRCASREYAFAYMYAVRMRENLLARFRKVQM